MAHPCRAQREKKQEHSNIWKEKVAEVLKTRDSRDPLRIKTKKKTYDYFLNSMPLVQQYKDFWIRKPEEWIAKSHNEDRQRISFLMWVFCKYKPPEFLFALWQPEEKAYYNSRGDHLHLKDMFLSWFIDIGQGGSFQKMASSMFTKKEAHLFLQPPKIKEKIQLKVDQVLYHAMWVKCKARKLSEPLCDLLAYRFSDFVILSPTKRGWNQPLYNTFYTKHLLDFLSHYFDNPLLTVNTLESVLDFITHIPYDAIPNFSFKGRTLNSIIQLSNQWHYQQTQTKNVKNASWPGLNINDYEFRDSNNVDWKITQLKSSSSLLVEGRKMHHCVGGYSGNCIDGGCGIFSVKNDLNGKIATIEVSNNRMINQIKGPCNKNVSKEDYKIIEKWAKQEGLAFQTWLRR